MSATFCQVNRIKIYFIIFRFIEVFFGNFFLVKRKMPLSKIFFADEKTKKTQKISIENTKKAYKNRTLKNNP